jgi:erythromycin esterase-like protein
MPMRRACLLAFLGLMPFAIAAAPAGTQPEFDAVVESATRTLCDKRIAALAELPSHGEGQAFALKAEVARRLVMGCGFQAVAFEAPIYEFL